MGVFGAGVGRRLMTYYSRDDGNEADLETFVAHVASEIQAEGVNGWQVVSTSFLSSREVRGGWLDTGSTRTSMYAAVVLLAKD